MPKIWYRASKKAYYLQIDRRTQKRLGRTLKEAEAAFRREAEAAAKLHHTNIVPVYATGEENGTHYYAMELIEGPSLDTVIRQRRQAGSEQPPTPLPSTPDEMGATGPYVESGSPSSDGAAALTSSSLSSGGHYFDTVARMIADVADALDHAHGQGVIHHDIKPSNLLQSPDGRLSVNDSGLARMLEQPGMTLTGEFVGTPAYMSPEQIAATVLHFGLIAAFVYRFGWLGNMVGASCTCWVAQTPLTTDVNAWYFGRGLVGAAVVLALGVYGFVTAVGGRRLFREGFFGDE